MITIDEILKADFDWADIEIDEDEFDELENELIIDYLKKNSPKERQLLAIDWNFDNSKEVIKWIRSVYKELHADHETGAADNK